MHDKSAVAFVLDYLRDGPARLDDLYRDARLQFGFDREDIAEAGTHLGILGKKLDGIPYVYRPHNVVAIWWGKRPRTYRLAMAADGGSAA
jgi:hypothetical protein